ncbi:MAG TPA: DUF3891 family protein [Rubricoccaceae bacterium]|jgi:hypothetical protein
MICTRDASGWELIYQDAHARIAGDLLRPLRSDLRPAPAGGEDRWEELLYATALHDNGWQEWEPGQHRTDLGAPRGYEDTPMPDVVAQSERALGRVRHASLFAALLVAEHIRSLYNAFDDPGVQAMLKAHVPLRARWRRVLGVTQADVDRHYTLLRWADTLSLHLCARRMPIDALRIEVGTLGAEAGGERTFAWQRPDGSVGLDPWPYDAPEVTVRTEAYLLTRLAYPSDAALAGALARARVRPAAWTLRPDAR